MRKRSGIINRGVQELKKQIRRFERLAGTLIITAGNHIVTVQRADREKQKRQIRPRH